MVCLQRPARMSWSAYPPGITRTSRLEEMNRLKGTRRSFIRRVNVTSDNSVHHYTRGCLHSVHVGCCDIAMLRYQTSNGVEMPKVVKMTLIVYVFFVRFHNG
jgi:hypothetical protein